MGLQEKLDGIRQGFEAQAGAPVVEVRHRATADLAASGLAERAIGEGDEAPSFELVSTQGDRIGLDALAAQGPVVMTFFRGHW